jgi:dTDP-4-dehydrorhamnose 3,5-epimerase
MKKIETMIPGVYIIETNIYVDARGWFMETWSEKNFDDLDIHVKFIQDNQSLTKKKGTLRGIHYQNAPFSQAKLVRVISGSVFDVAVDLRKESPTYKMWVSVELSADNKKQLFIPRGCGHAFLTLSDNVVFVYKCDNLYSKESDRGIKYNDPEINIMWPITNPILSEKDMKAPFLFNSDCDFHNL